MPIGGPIDFITLCGILEFFIRAYILSGRHLTKTTCVMLG
ncbi:hypothetical protein DSUL_20364 [Desulfovibrionales bacterium]